MLSSLCSCIVCVREDIYRGTNIVVFFTRQNGREWGGKCKWLRASSFFFFKFCLLTLNFSEILRVRAIIFVFCGVIDSVAEDEHALHHFVSGCNLSALGRVALNLQKVMLRGSNGTPRVGCVFGGIAAGLQRDSENAGWGRGSRGKSVVL